MSPHRRCFSEENSIVALSITAGILGWEEPFLLNCKLIIVMTVVIKSRLALDCPKPLVSCVSSWLYSGELVWPTSHIHLVNIFVNKVPRALDLLGDKNGEGRKRERENKIG